MTTDVKESIAELIKLQAELSAKLSSITVEGLNAYLMAWVANQPLVEAIQWKQYAPGFNDGDPCTFNIYEVEVKLNAAGLALYNPAAPAVEGAESNEDDDEDDEDEEDADFLDGLGKYDTCSTIYAAPELEALDDALAELQGELEAIEAVCERVYDGNAKITATKDEVEYDYYDCGH